MRTLLCVVALVAATSAPANAALFVIGFDNIGDDLPVDPPLVGTGTISWTGAAVDGVFPLLSLPGFDVLFDFGGDTFTLTDAATPLAEVLVVVSGGATEVFFSNTGPVSGPFVGAIDFVDATNTTHVGLSFEPPGFSPPPASLYFTNDITGGGFFGDYGTDIARNAVPEPSSLAAALGLAIVCAGFGVFRRRGSVTR